MLLVALCCNIGAMPDSRSRPPEDFLPLKPVVFSIILILLKQEYHGYGIVKELTRQKPPGLSLFPASLYRSLRRMLDDGLIESRERTVRASQEDKKRVYFRVTRLGRRVAHAEAQRLDALLGTARSLRLLGDSDAAEGDGVTP